jgi:hypothetical protein
MRPRGQVLLAGVVAVVVAGSPASAVAQVYAGDSAVQLKVTPRDAEVFVDGYLVGIVDDYDGNFQRLPLPPGEHEIVLYREGYRTVRQKILLTPGATYRVKHAMEPLGAGETAEPRPTPPPLPPPEPPGARRGPDAVFGPPGARRAPPASPSTANVGTLSVRVQPADAEVWVDGERWQWPGDEPRLVVEVNEGRHRVEVTRDGFETFSTEVDVRRGETTSLNVSLLRREP